MEVETNTKSKKALNSFKVGDWVRHIENQVIGVIVRIVDKRHLVFVKISEKEYYCSMTGSVERL